MFADLHLRVRPTASRPPSQKQGRQCHSCQEPIGSIVGDCRFLTPFFHPRLQNELANAILGGEFEEGSRIIIDIQNGDFTFGNAL